MTDNNENGGETREHDGRSVKIDTGFYEVQVWGDPDDSFAEVQEAAFDAADRARQDVEEMDDQLDGDDQHYA